MRRYNKYKKYAKSRKVIKGVNVIVIMLLFMSAMAIGYSLLSDNLTITRHIKCCNIYNSI